MHLNRRTNVALLQLRAQVLVKFAVRLAELQHRAGRFFLVENPAGSMAWRRVAALGKLEEKLDGVSVIFDQCELGLTDVNGVPHRKRTRVVTNCREIAEGLSVFRCRRDHPHSPVIGGSKVTARAGHYPRGMVKVILSGR